MTLVMSEYLEVNLIGVVLLLTILIFRIKGGGAEQKYFVGMLVLNMLILLTDNGIYLLRGHGSPSLLVLNYCVCAAYFIMHSWFCYCWTRYVLLRLYPRYRPDRPSLLLLLLPALIGSALAAASPFSGWMYTLSAENVYHRGPFVWITFLVSIIYWAFSSVIVLKERFRPTRSRERGEYRTLLIFPLPLIIGNLLQLRFYGLSVVWICAAISMLILFINMQRDKLSRDELTGLYNRRQTNAQLAWELGRLRDHGDLLFVAMLDVDHFKKINDMFGHLSGDRALAAVAGVLKENCRKSDFVSRFGGDEFLLVGHVKSREDADAVILRIENALEKANETSGFPYALTLSIGYALFGPDDEADFDSVLGEADRKMYELKRLKHDAQATAGKAACR